MIGRCFLVASLAFMAACSSGRETSTSPSSTNDGQAVPATRIGTLCEQLGQTLCPRMQACPEIEDPSDCTAFNANGSHGFSCAMCRRIFEKDVCGDTTKPDALFRDCMAALDANADTCGPDPSGSSGRGLVLPTACSTIFDCGSGPCKN